MTEPNETINDTGKYTGKTDEKEQAKAEEAPTPKASSKVWTCPICHLSMSPRGRLQHEATHKKEIEIKPVVDKPKKPKTPPTEADEDEDVLDPTANDNIMIGVLVGFIMLVFGGLVVLRRLGDRKTPAPKVEAPKIDPYEGIGRCG
jgi:hypothetical protein